jgi:hypothetical protein
LTVIKVKSHPHNPGARDKIKAPILIDWGFFDLGNYVMIGRATRFGLNGTSN